MLVMLASMVAIMADTATVIRVFHLADITLLVPLKTG
jgi:hypothetical protein